MELDGALASADRQKASEIEARIRALGADAFAAAEREAGGGSREAQFAIGLLRSRGLLVAQDMARACEDFVRAAEAGLAAAQYQAALCVVRGEPERAARLMRAAAGQGHAAAQEAIGRACMEDRRRDLDCAVRNLAAAAKAGRPSAQSLFAWMHARGVGVDREPITALALYLLAARAGDLAAQNNLGELYETGADDALEKNPRRAALWYEGAARAGFVPAQFNLGRLYASGSGVSHDLAQARFWLGKAGAAGVPEAAELLRRLGTRNLVAPAGKN